MNEEVSVTDYGIFDDAINISEQYTGSVESFRDACSEFRNVIGDDSVFMGPIADSYVAAFSEIDTTVDSMVEDNKTIRNYLGDVSSNYQKGDRDASNAITSVDNMSLSSSGSSGGKSNEQAIFIGDSRTVGMQSAVGNTGDVWSGKVSSGLNWMKSTGLPNVEGQIKEGSNVVVMMGVNDCQYNSNAYVSYLNDLSQKAEEKGANLYFVSVNPTSGSYDNLNSSIDSFNQTVKNGVNSNVKYIDSNSYLKSNGFNSSDGLHYDAATYEKLYSYIKNNM